MNAVASAPRIFISYARIDGEDFAKELRGRLEVEGIQVWQDRTNMEGGRDWWLQIVEILDHVEFMVLIMTPAAMRSPLIRKEWHAARQKGVCVYPVKGHPELDFASLPRWIRDVHCFDLEHEWTKFVSDLNKHCEITRVPFMVEDLPLDFVQRPHEFEELISKLLDENREEPVAITAALRGAGGYGKTTLAKAICHSERIQEAFDDGILWVTLGEHPGELTRHIEDLIYILSGKRPGFVGLSAATTYLAELIADRDILMVIDDVWNQTHLKPFLQGGKRCARLITTRDDRTLPLETLRIRVDAMNRDEAVQLLRAGLDYVLHSADDIQDLQSLATKLGEWPLLLTLVNGVLRRRVHDSKQSLSDALSYINTALEKRGLTVFDASDAEERNQAVKKTLGVSLEHLDKKERNHYYELGIFPEDVDIPLVTVRRLWSETDETGRFDDFDTTELCERLSQMSLLSKLDLTAEYIRLHDVMRGYLRIVLGQKLLSLHMQFLDSYAISNWAELPIDEPYLWDQLAYHLIEARREGELVETVKDLNYLATKISIRKASAPENDLLKAIPYAPGDNALSLLQRSLSQSAHILNRCETLNEVMSVLYSRLQHLGELQAHTQKLKEVLRRPYIEPWHTLPDLPSSTLIRTLSGHSDWVIDCAISAGTTIVSASYDQTLKIWDANTGTVLQTLSGHTRFVSGCAISGNGSIVVSASYDRTLKIWDARTGSLLRTLHGHTGAVLGCAISTDGAIIASASWDKTLKIWDTDSGKELLTLRGHQARVTRCAISADRNIIVSASYDKTLKIWDTGGKDEGSILHGHTRSVEGCAISADGTILVTASSDGTLKVWDTKSGTERLTLRGHAPGVNGCAISRNGTLAAGVSGAARRTITLWDIVKGVVRLTLDGHTGNICDCAIGPDESTIVSASDDQTLKVWDANLGDEYHFTLRGHTGAVRGCAISTDGSIVVSASNDQTLKIWETSSGGELLTLRGHTGAVSSCAISVDGNNIVSTSSDGVLKVWEVKSERCMATLYVDGQFYKCVWFPDRERIAATGDYGLYFLRLVE